MPVTEANLTRVLGERALDYLEPTYDCPFCKLRLADAVFEQLGPGHLHVSIDKSAALCHRCEYSTRNLRGMLFHVSRKLSKRILRQTIGKGVLKAVTKILDKPEPDVAADDAEPALRLPKEYRPLTFPVKGLMAELCAEYLERRGVSTDMAESCNVGYAVDGRFGGMLIFPIHMGAALVFYTARAVLPTAPMKMLHAKAPRGRVVFNFNNAAQAQRVFVCEGVFDALSWPAEAGVGIATLGHKLGDSQARLLATLPAKEFVVCYDADSFALTIEAARLLDKFVGANVTYIQLKSGDPNSERKRLKRYFRGRKRASLAGHIAGIFNLTE